ncbi:SCO2400 family protein [Actinacidiphila acidipaludis]|uniref:Uncharacterized protein n=1 Tax=Actinacidiphila acidipaludis TaxID=2873382 RepID=A0ABS7Q7B2_9ACTN|nr:hypothetical protein [Streptomyces acidipaludis]MBY8879040.1 hypothetical protein [Streptomyces acidipaludis]
MDYCYSCRRTLNGALVCPGCGAYAPDIAPPAGAYQGDGTTNAAWESYGLAPAGHPGGSAGPLPDGLLPGHPAPFGGWTTPDEHAYAAHPGYHGGAPAPAGAHGYPGRTESSRPRLAALIDAETAGPDGGEEPETGTPSVLGPASLAPTLHRGRAARRRQMERWKKNRRRAGVATAVALFGGGVTVASMQGHSGRSGATTASAADPQAPTALQTDNTAVSLPNGGTAPSAAPSHVATQQHSSATRPAPRTTHAGPDSITSIPASVIPSGQPVSYSSATKPRPSTGATTAPVAPTDNGSGSTTANSGSGSTTSTPPATPPPSSAPPATTAPSTPPPQQLCLLIVCLG